MANIKERWDFRVATDTDDLIRRAAQTAEKTLTDFVVTAATVEAQRILADRTRFVLSPEDWDQFVDRLEQPPQEKPGLERLLSKPSLFSD
ncbi:MAG: DUF1778 domain-containing protein [Dehalococcoidia bacterium]